VSGSKPCCAAAAAARLRYLVVVGNRIAIAQLDEILEEAKAKEPAGEPALRKELLRLVKTSNFVPAAAEKAYEEALFAEYSARKGQSTGHAGKGK
jgi:hypothetical protein